MGSEYDHVGILMRDLDEKLFVIESTGTWGVSAIAMEHFVENEWWNSYEKLVYRQLKLDV